MSTTKKVVSKTRSILGINLSTKIPNEMKAIIEVIKANKGKANVSFDALFKQFVIQMNLISKSKSNLKTRFRRLLYRNLEGVLLKNSIQSAKFNLKANINGIVVKAKDKIEYKANGDAVTNTVDNNSFSFQVKEVKTVNERKISKALLTKIAKLKDES